MQNTGVLPEDQRNALLSTLKARFAQNMQRHSGLHWDEVQARLEATAAKLWSLHEMERTGGEPDVVGYDPRRVQCIFCDCSPESPAGRRSVCYDHAGLESRKEHRPDESAVDMPAAIGVELLTEAQYRALQELGDFDQKSSSWLATPPDIRQRGGALFGDRRYGHVFVYHNGAQSYFSSRGFRASLWV